MPTKPDLSLLTISEVAKTSPHHSHTGYKPVILDSARATNFGQKFCKHWLFVRDYVAIIVAIKLPMNPLLEEVADIETLTLQATILLLFKSWQFWVIWHYSRFSLDIICRREGILITREQLIPWRLPYWNYKVKIAAISYGLLCTTPLTFVHFRNWDLELLLQMIYGYGCSGSILV